MVKNRLVNDKYDIIVPDVIADWDAPSHWERERFDSMEKHLKDTDVLFCVGAEWGWMEAVFAKYFTPKVVLFEPTPDFWPGIRLTWEANKLPLPLAHFVGLVGRESDDEVGVEIGNWAPASYEKKLLERSMPYKYLHEHKDVPKISIDDFNELTDSSKAPDALSIDVEGAEYEVLLGAENTLKRHHPLVWVSIHPDLLLENYGATPDQIHDLMKNLGYTGKRLATDHEEHWLYE